MDRVPGRILARQQAPLAARTQQVENPGNIERKHVVRGCPSGFAGGSGGSTMVQAASLRSV
jgi:hypothetical protein